MVKNHPHQFVYFNKLAGNNPANYFDLDYWGTSNRSSLAYLVENDKSDKINIFILSDTPYQYSVLLIDNDEQKRINFFDSANDADYLVTNHHYRSGNPIEINNKLKKRYKLLKEFKVDNLTIKLSIYNLLDKTKFNIKKVELKSSEINLNSNEMTHQAQT